MNAGHAPVVAEMQGCYGPFTFSELLLQQIWWRGEFDLAQARTVDGRALMVLQPGKWNRLGGPDFRGARLRIGEQEIVGDVELHLYANDWDAHRHAVDPAYGGVALHAVLFPPAAGHTTRRADGTPIPVVVMLPLLHHDLEEYAAEEAVERLANRPMARAIEELSARPAGELAALLEREAERRWQMKVHFARRRVERLGWEAACHHTALEVLGYRFNRAPMLSVAARWSLAEWARGGVSPEEAFAVEAGRWSLQGVRPANHPRLRLQQYAAWVRAAPDWPTRVAALARELPSGIASGESTAVVRRRGGFSGWRERLAREIAGGALGGTRWDNWVCDGLLPLCAAGQGAAGYGMWHHWYPGDAPPQIGQALRALGVFGRRDQPACHGCVQGLIGWWLARENEAMERAALPSGRGA